MKNLFQKSALSALMAALLSAGGLNSTAIAENNADSSAAQNQPPATRPDRAYPRGMHPMAPPPGYYPPAANPYYPPPAWGYRTPFDSPRFRQFDHDPFAEIQRMQQEIDQLINDTFQRFGVDRHFARMNSVITPGLDLRDEGDHYVAVVDIPGADKDAINIKLDEQTLSISAEQHQENKRTDSKGNIIFQERRSGMFKRMVTLPEPVSASGMKSDYKDGVLTITIPKKS